MTTNTTATYNTNNVDDSIELIVAAGLEHGMHYELEENAWGGIDLTEGAIKVRLAYEDNTLNIWKFVNGAIAANTKITGIATDAMIDATINSYFA